MERRTRINLMKLKEYLTEEEGKLITLYHVTLTKNLQKITQKGILLMQPTNWVKAGDDSRYGEGDIYAMTNEIDAIRWAGKMDWEFNEKIGSGDIAIVEFKSNPELWKEDEADPISQAGNKGKWLKSSTPVKPFQIVDGYPATHDVMKKAVLHEDDEDKAEPIAMEEDNLTEIEDSHLETVKILAQKRRNKK